MAPAPSPTTAHTSVRLSARLLGALSAAGSLATTWLLALAITNLATSHVTRGLEELLIVVIARWAISVGLSEWGDFVSTSIRRYWRRALPQHFALPTSEHEHSRGNLSLAIDQAAEAPFLEVLSTSGRVAVLGLAIVLWAGGWLSFSITLALLLIAIPLYQRAGRRSEAMSIEYAKRRSVLEERQLELLRHAPEMRALGVVSFGAREIAAISDAEHAVALRAIRVALESSLVTEFLSGVSIGLVAMTVGFALLGGRISLSHALIAVLITSEIFAQVRRFGTEFHRRENAVKSLALLSSLSTVTPRSSAETTTLISSRSLVTSVNSTPINLNLARGERLIITGRSGIGKTTLLSTLVGWSPVVSGDVTCTAQPIGYVSVSSSLFSGTLRDNIEVGGEHLDRELRAMLSSLGLDGDRFDDLDTHLLPDGRGFSTGERVRLILARSLLWDPAVLILDDIAGVLDQNARDQVQRTLDAHPDLAIIEATVDNPMLTGFITRIELA